MKCRRRMAAGFVHGKENGNCLSHHSWPILFSNTLKKLFAFLLKIHLVYEFKLGFKRYSEQCLKLHKKKVDLGNDNGRLPPTISCGKPWPHVSQISDLKLYVQEIEGLPHPNHALDLSTMDYHLFCPYGRIITIKTARKNVGQEKLRPVESLTLEDPISTLLK